MVHNRATNAHGGQVGSLVPHGRRDGRPFAVPVPAVNDQGAPRQAMAQSFDVQVSADDCELVARVSGDLDLTARTSLVDAVTAPLGHGGAVRRLAVDLERVTFCDSSGLGALLDIRRASSDAGIDMVLRNVPLPVARLLDMTDVDGWLRRE